MQPLGTGIIWQTSTLTGAGQGCKCRVCRVCGPRQHPHRQLPMARSTLYTFRDQEVVYPLPPYQHVTQCVSANYVRPLLLFLSSPHPTSRGGSGRLVDPFRPHAGRQLNGSIRRERKGQTLWLTELGVPFPDRR